MLRRFSIDIDEPRELGGSNRFANPQEHLIAQLLQFVPSRWPHPGFGRRVTVRLEEQRNDYEQPPCSSDCRPQDSMVRLPAVLAHAPLTLQIVQLHDQTRTKGVSIMYCRADSHEKNKGCLPERELTEERFLNNSPHSRMALRSFNFRSAACPKTSNSSAASCGTCGSQHVPRLAASTKPALSSTADIRPPQR